VGGTTKRRRKRKKRTLRESGKWNETEKQEGEDEGGTRGRAGARGACVQDR